MSVEFGSTFRHLLKASVAATALMAAISGAALAAERVNDEAPSNNVDEVIVTGTNIRRAVTATAALQTITRDDFDRNGFLDVGQALRSLPANFSGGANSETQIAGGTLDQIGSNRTRVSGANLHGLGNGATLTLLNGKRLPASGQGLTVDLSMIPAAAIERVDVLADGSSAVYGTDAVAGVVNIITRRNYDGIETRLRYGAAAGGLGTYTGSILAGGKAGSLSGVAGVELFKQNDLGAEKRERASLIPRPYDLFPESARASFFASSQYEIAPQTKLYIDGLYMQRTADSQNNAKTGLTLSPQKVFQYSISPGLTSRFANGWDLDVFGSLAKNVSKSTSTFIPVKGAITTPSYDYRQDVKNVEGRGSGPLFKLPGGLVEVAAGAAYREENMASRVSTSYLQERKVSSVYAEIDVPIVGPENRIPFIEALNFNFADRRDDYSDVGAVSVPKFGAVWKIVPSLQVTGTYSKSFRAPSLYEHVANYAVGFVDVTDNSPGGKTRAIYLDGAGAPLDPERSENINIGFTFRPERLSGLNISASYYNIDYKARIARPDPTFIYLLDIRNAPASLVQRNPDIATVNALIAHATSTSAITAPSTDPTLVRAIIDGRPANIATTEMEGVDASASYRTRVGSGSIEFSGQIAYVAKFKDQLTPTSPQVSRVGTIFSPPRFRSRSGVQWDDRSWTASAFWNYVDNYVDNRVASSPKPVKAWNTFDVNVGYDLGASNEAWNGTRITVSVTNLFDRSPPLVAPLTVQFSGAAPTQWDPANASIVGRFASIEIVKTW